MSEPRDERPEERPASEHPAPEHPAPEQPAAEQPAAQQPAAEQPQPRQHAAEGRPDDIPQPVAGSPSALPPPTARTRSSRARDTAGRVVRHRATQLAAAGVLGMLIGGGIVGLTTHGDGGHHRGGPAAYGRFYGGPPMPPRWDQRGFGHRGQHGGPRPAPPYPSTTPTPSAPGAPS